MEAEKEDEKNGRMSNKQKQQQLNFKTMTGPREFTRAGILDAVTRLIATNNQVNFEHEDYYRPYIPILANCTCGQHKIPQCPRLNATKIHHGRPSNIVQCENTPT
jgi:hypothetical protein